MINNIDFAPTLIELAGGKAPEYMDGKALLMYLKVKLLQTGKMRFTTDTGCT